MSTTTGKDLNLVKPAVSDDIQQTIGTDLPNNFQKIDDEFTSHKAENVTDTSGVHGLKIEEGTYTPTIYGSTTSGSNTYATQNGKYIKHNNKVTCWGYVMLSAKDVTTAGSMRIGGLPFVVGTTPVTHGAVCFGNISNIDFNTGELYLTGYPTAGSARCELKLIKDNSNFVALQSAAIQDTTSIIFSFEYYV